MSLLKIENFEHLVKDTKTNAVVNTSKSEFQLYMKRRQERNKNGDKLRNACKEINNLKSELREIKSLLTKVLEK
tara:strand:- start:155 stop:376 length:222 start_codon:yes stop_codon:yes gene_type:complete